MKKLIITLVTLSAFATADAQKIYVRAGLGYAVPQGGQLYDMNGFPLNGKSNAVIPATGGQYSETFEVKKASFAAGVHATIAAGAMVTKHLGVELMADIGAATKKTGTSLSQTDGLSTITYDINQQSKLPVLLIPSAVIQSGGKLNFYARGGVVIPVKATIDLEATIIQDDYNIATTNTVRTTYGIGEKYKTRMSPGFAGAMGVRIAPTKKISVFGEISLLSLNLYYKESEVTTLTQNGMSVLNQLTPAEKTTKYEFEGTLTGTSNTMPTYSVPFSTIGVNVGVAFGLF
ncbi:MAG: hypothetical protein H6551_09305 [Chitinophagales bacterium]|nr:hypothetical protein [Chitinophagaceae bacterium]MCB9065319.1 hypothetical protein [Chitinophagales bacterium]